MPSLLDKGLKAKRESKFVDFKREFDPASPGEWCELIKDIVAMANSGGGVILIGIDDGGIPSNADVTAILALDHAKVLDKIRKYTGSEFVEIEVHEAQKGADTIALLEVAAMEVPIVFQEVGTYEGHAGKQKTAFSKRTVYFRHGAKSEPGTTTDLRNVIERRLKAIRAEWLDGVRKVVTAPQGSAVSIFAGDVRESDEVGAVPIRLVTDPEAPGYRLIDHDTTYPYRQKEFMGKINDMLPDGVNVSTYDILAVRRVHDIDRQPTYCHTPKFGSPQYSDSFATWIVASHKENNEFFAEARSKYHQGTHGSGK